MSSFMSKKRESLVAYTPGEQPKNRKYIKLNTNESPFPPSENVSRAINEAGKSLQLYSDPQCTELNKVTAEYLGVKPEQILMTNGSDEALGFIFAAFGDEDNPFVFPDITYGFYPVFAQFYNVPYREIPLKDDFSVSVDDYIGVDANIVIANPNAPTGLSLPLEAVERITASNPNHVVVIDEAYVDFGGQSAVTLINKYKNLLVTRTFSKSYSLAGARLGFAVGCEELIDDLNTIKYSTNPYNVNSMTMAAGTAAIKDAEYYSDNCLKIIENREYAKQELEKLGFEVIDSKANFLFAKHPELDGKELYLKLKDRGVLIRHFDKDRIKDYNRITIGTKDQMDKLLEEIEDIMA